MWVALMVAALVVSALALYLYSNERAGRVPTEVRQGS
jgi:hypothetical protein